eukprot:TRINITY_DN261_c0_g2_i1.p1 TRINITY_DN261_c0_g2~~TRINITY_DN261_c0_g2_i1.p1  ORF type:complete len:177 (+),score=51.36 TRINITY_DN261_c0_g2_i1:66-596(+)
MCIRDRNNLFFHSKVKTHTYTPTIIIQSINKNNMAAPSEDLKNNALGTGNEEEDKLKEIKHILEKHPGKIPVICRKHEKSKISTLDKNKFLVVNTLRVHQFLQAVRKRINLAKDQTIFLFVNDKHLLKGDSVFEDVYKKHKSADGFLYISYYEHESFGADQQRAARARRDSFCIPQ